MARVAVLGAGKLGSALVERLVQAGVDVRFGVRDPAAAARQLTGGAADVDAVRPDDAAAEAAIVLLAVPAVAAIEAVGAAGNLQGKILVDCTNPVRRDNGPVWAAPPEGSVAQALAAAFPGVTVIKGFNHFGADVVRSPELASGAVDAFFAGDNQEAKSSIIDLARRMGFRPHDAGPLRNAALLENLAILWIHLATVGGFGRTFGFRIDDRRVK
jgi:NADPH-dependent F420 reductase